MCQRRHRCLRTCCSWGNWARAPVSCRLAGADKSVALDSCAVASNSQGQWYTIQELGEQLQRRLAGIRYLSLWVIAVRNHLFAPRHAQPQHMSVTSHQPRHVFRVVNASGLPRPATLATWRTAQQRLASELHRFHLVSSADPGYNQLWLARSILVPGPQPKQPAQSAIMLHVFDNMSFC